LKRALAAGVLLALSSHAAAEKLALGTMDLQACARGKERATLVLDVEAPDIHRVRGELRRCAEHGVATVTLPALIRRQPSAVPEFWEEFKVCARYTEWISAELSIHTTCR
jgi:hypothetical protein